MKQLPKGIWIAAAALALGGGGAHAYIEAIYPLQQFIAESEVIAEGVIEKADPKTKTCIVRITGSIKGKCVYTLVKMNIGVGQDWHPDPTMRHMVVGAPAILFYNAERRGEIYINRFFMQLYGDAAAPPESAWWNFTHIEVRCNRTFNGTTEEFSKLLKAIVAGKEKPPAPDPKVPVITAPSVMELPVWGKTSPTGVLPAPFRKRDPSEKTPVNAVPVNDEGFIMNWLVLGPIPVGPQGADHSEGAQKPIFDKDWVPNQKNAQPKGEEKATVNGQAMAWQVMESTDFVLDLGGAENSYHLALAYVVAESDMPDLALLIGSDDSSAWWLNGQEVFRVYEGRGYGKDQNRAPKPVTLKKGVNVLLAGVINGGGPTGCCARFVDKAGNPVKNIHAGSGPVPKR